MSFIIGMLFMFAFAALMGLWPEIYRDYVAEHPELSETPAMRKRRRETERIAAALRYGLESGRLSPSEYESLYEEKVKARESKEIEESPSDNDGASQDGSWWDGVWGDGGDGGDGD